MAERLTYRLYRERDIPALVGLWEEDAAWGALTEDTWRTWYIDTPNGESLVAVAEDETGALAGQLVLSPVRLQVGDREVRALRLSAPILRTDLRDGPLFRPDHPVVGLLRCAFDAARRRGYALLYAQPQEGWLLFLRWLTREGLWRFLYTHFPCVASPFGSPPAPAAPLAARRVAEFGPAYTELWEASRRALPVACGVVRFPEWIRWKNGPHIVLELRRPAGKRIAGYMAVRRSDGLLFDGLVRHPDDCAPALAATRAWFAPGAPGAGLVEAGTLRVLQTPLWQPALDALGFTPLDYRFLLACHVLDPALEEDLVAPERWYLMPGD